MLTVLKAYLEKRCTYIKKECTCIQSLSNQKCDIKGQVFQARAAPDVIVVGQDKSFECNH